MGVQDNKDYSGEVICLKCRKKFQSKDRRSNRLCKKCTNANSSLRISPIIIAAGLCADEIEQED